MTLKLKALLEGYAWERRADGSLPTLRDAIAVHAANLGENVLEDTIAKAEKELKQVKDKWYNLNDVSNPSATQQAQKDRLKKQMGDLVTQLKRDKRELNTGSAGYKSNSNAKPDFLDLDGDGNETESMKSAAASGDSSKYGNFINKARAKSHLTKKDGTVYGHDASGNATKLNSYGDANNTKYTKFTIKSDSVNEYGEPDFDRSSQMYGGGKSSRESEGDMYEIVEKLEDVLDRCMQDLSTNSNVPTSEKSLILRQLVKMSDLINKLQDNI
jgi:hypothetical protein